MPNVACLPPIPPTFGYNNPVTGQHSGMMASFESSFLLCPAAPQGTSDRPRFPVTRKPRGNDPWQQMEYERFWSGAKPTSPGIIWAARCARLSGLFASTSTSTSTAVLHRRQS
ncbi:hypothetical protein GQ53DRAFT_743991 [Thozetella sp. PMI_491]|nr:hypothetical protein GQ53DRAFT_743991 [Thozetella sp. PMI_491]